MIFLQKDPVFKTIMQFSYCVEGKKAKCYSEAVALLLLRPESIPRLAWSLENFRSSISLLANQQKIEIIPPDNYFITVTEPSLKQRV